MTASHATAPPSCGTGAANDSGKQRRQTAEPVPVTDTDSNDPLARIDRNSNQEQNIYYFHTDVNGIPEELTDEAGEILWECSYQL